MEDTDLIILAKSNEIQRLHKVCQGKDTAIKAAINELHNILTRTLWDKKHIDLSKLINQITGISNDLNDCLG